MSHLHNLLLPFSFELPTRVLFGPGSLREVTKELKQLGVSKPLIVTDPGIVAAGILDKVLEQLSGEIQAIIFSEVSPNPKDLNVVAGANVYRESGTDGILALGGGSPIDCAKGIGVLVANEANDIRAFAGRGIPSRPLPPLLAIPTTAGTGSEITFSCVLNDTSQNIKFTVKNAYTAPRVAICDPELTTTLPPAITAATGMDALTHAIEAYTATCAEPISDALALYAIELITASLETAFNYGANLTARSTMLMGSLLAGMAFSHSDVAGIHCIAEALGGLYDLPHGVCNAIILPHMMSYCMDYCQERYARIARAMGLLPDQGAAGAAQAVAKVQELAAAVRLPLFKELQVDPSEFPKIALRSYENGSNPSNPRPMTADDYLQLLHLMQGV
ncbi:MAG: iron-containing alcohol dehydrogenase [Symbiobacteriaceae bacterium]|nr:iron-containing alcohol dehydrogenase [Symbiobacteriaceae bacterium]